MNRGLFLIDTRLPVSKETDAMARYFQTMTTAAALAVPVIVLGAAALAHDIREIGDGKFSSAPKSGYLYSCQTRFSANAPGATGTGPWVNGKTFDADQKPSVAGEVVWPNARISVTREGNQHVVRANNLPTHPTGIFPISPNDPAYRYDRNPNTIREQNILLRLPADPDIAAQPSCVPMGMIGFTLTGGALYNAIDARGHDAPAYEVLDKCGGHPQRNGQYHYHDLAPCLPTGRDKTGHSELIGYALDGFGIYGPYEADGRELSNDDLGPCHGHIGPVMWDGEVRTMFHYHMNDAYPYSIGCFRGTPVSVPRLAAGQTPDGPAGLSGAPRGGSSMGQPPRQHSGGPGSAPRSFASNQQSQGQRGMGPRGNDPLAAVAADLGVDANTLRALVGPPPPDLQRASTALGISVARLQAVFAAHRPR
jgi:YHYH protein